MSKYVIVRSNRLNTFSNKIDSNNLKVLNMFSTMNVLCTICKEVLLKFRIKLPDNFFNSELKNVDADTIIVFDGHARVEFLIWLKKHNKGKRIILWLWNTVEEIGNNLLLDDVPDGIEIWSYSKYDCQRYGLKYNTTFYWNNHVESKSGNISSDLYFIGKDKGRLSKVKKVRSMCDDLGLKGVFNVVKTHKYSFPKREYSSQIGYDEVKKHISETRAILDLKVSPTAGPSIRSLESAFYRKKLVTDDKEVESFRFYNKSNIFIIDSDNNENLREFLYSDYQDINSEDIEYYNLQNWLERFE